jgi:hypothetical protein
MIKYKMDNRGKAAALVGLSAIGSILAYYGYSQYSNEEPDKTGIVEVKNDSNEPSDINDASSESISDTVSNYITKIVNGENIKLQVNEKNTVDLKKTGKEVLKEALGSDAPTDKKSDPRQTWSKYWTKHTGEGDSVESTDADDKSADADDKREVVAADFN